MQLLRWTSIHPHTKMDREYRAENT